MLDNVLDEPIYRRRVTPDPDNPNQTITQYVDQWGNVGNAYKNQLSELKPAGRPPRMAGVVRVNDPFMRLYRNNVQQVVAEQMLTVYEFGILVQLCAFTGWGTLFVTDEEGQRLSLSQIANTLGVSKGYLSTVLRSLEDKGFVRIYKPDNSRSNFVMVNGSVSFFGKWLNDEGEGTAFDDSPYMPMTQIIHPNKKRRGGVV